MSEIIGSRNKTYSLQLLVVMVLISMMFIEIVCMTVFFKYYKSSYLKNVILNDISSNVVKLRTYNDEMVSNIILNQKEARRELLNEVALITGGKVGYVKDFDANEFNSHFSDDGQLEYYSRVQQDGNYSIVVPLLSMGDSYGHIILANDRVSDAKDISSIYYILLIINVIFMMAVAVSVYIIFNRYFYQPIQIIIKGMTKCHSRQHKSKDPYWNVPTGIREVRSLESNLRKIIEKMEMNAAMVAIGETASQIAHDVRKPLTSMKALLAVMPEKRFDGIFIEEMIKRVDSTIDRTNSMLSDILEFSKDATNIERKPQNPQSLIAASLSEVFRVKTDADVNISYRFNHHKALFVDSNKILRVFNNTIDNAVEAMNGAGELWFETEDMGEQLKVVIGNNGPAIPEDVQGKLFDPYFTRNKKGGTGLGLAICRKIVEIHDGTISVVSTADKTEFVMSLPGVEGCALERSGELINSSRELRQFIAEKIQRDDGGGESLNIVEFMKLQKRRGRDAYLMIVDDEPLFRETLRSSMNGISQVRDHVKIVEADSAETALQIFKAREINYIIIDIDLGINRINGYELAEEILQKYPNTYVLIHSNKRIEEMDKEIRRCSRARFMGFLPKPMEKTDLLQFLVRKSFETKKPIKESRSGRKKVLIVNDDEAVLISLKYMLKSQQVEIFEAMSVEDALRIYDNEDIDVILSDINLGDGYPDGYFFIKRIREMDVSVPFYFISGYSKAEEEGKVKRAGAQGYIQLPIDISELEIIFRK